MLRFLTAGESHGPGLTAIIEGLPPGIPVCQAELAREQARRRWCYGRGGRAEIERDELELTGGISQGRTTGAPVSVWIPNRDHANWAGQYRPIWAPRPGHADLAGVLKYRFEDARPVAERASARETAARVACGYLAKQLLRQVGITIGSWVMSIGGVAADLPPYEDWSVDQLLVSRLVEAAEPCPVRCPDPDAARGMMQAIDEARADGDTLGGVFEVVATGVPAGLGSYVHWDRRLDTALAGALMSINGVKAVAIGLGFDVGNRRGSHVHDAIEPAAEIDGGWSVQAREAPDIACVPMGAAANAPPPLRRRSNHAGGIEGGVSNGQIIIARAAHKPLPMLCQPMHSVDLRTGEACLAHHERSDVTAAPCAAVVAESMLALVLASAWLERHGHDGLAQPCQP